MSAYRLWQLPAEKADVGRAATNELSAASQKGQSMPLAPADLVGVHPSSC